MEWDLEDLKQSIIDSAADYDKIMKEDEFIQSLISKGFVYDEDKDFREDADKVSVWSVFGLPIMDKRSV